MFASETFVAWARPLFGASLSLFLLGCAGSTSTPAGTKVMPSGYNKQVRELGVEHFCGGGACDEPPTLIHGRAPAYPTHALRDGLSGRAVVAYDISEEGRVENVVVREASMESFGVVAARAVQQWRYRPARLRGEPIRLQVEQEFPFESSR